MISENNMKKKSRKKTANVSFVPICLTSTCQVQEDFRDEQIPDGWCQGRGNFSSSHPRTQIETFHRCTRAQARRPTWTKGNRRPTAKLDNQLTVPAIMKAAGRYDCSNSSPVRMKGIPPGGEDRRQGQSGSLWVRERVKQKVTQKHRLKT